MFLADLGATVIKVERPLTGDDNRARGPPYVGATSTYYASVNRNKRSLTLDLGEPGDQQLARRLATRADVFVENYRPGRLASSGLDSCTRHAPRLVRVATAAPARGPAGHAADRGASCLRPISGRPMPLST